MNLQKGRTYLLTTNNGFHVPDGRLCFAILGRIRSTTGGHIAVGNVLIEHDEVRYAVETVGADLGPAWRDIDTGDGFELKQHNLSRIYDARPTSSLEVVER